MNRGARRRLWPRILGTVLLASLAGSYLWMRGGIASTEDERSPDTDRVRKETLDRTVAATGVIRPMVGAEINVGSRISGIVRRIPVAVGDMVDEGDLLARIDPTELEAGRDQALADRELAEAELSMAVSAHARALAMKAEGIVPEIDLEIATRDLEVARARLAREEARVSSAETMLGYTEIRAPIRGVIAEVTTREGETVAASFAAPTFVTIVDLDRLEVQAYVDETDVGRIVIGQTAVFTVDTYPEAEFTARVTAINPRAALQNGVVNYIVRLEFEPESPYVLRPEMTAHVDLLVEQRSEVLTVPRKAIRRDGGRELVLVKRDGAWVDQVVTTGWRTDRRVEVLDGLSEGEIVQLNEE